MRQLEELLTAKKWPYQQADIRPIPDDDTDQVQQRVKGQAVRGSVRSTCHQNICRLCNHMRWRCVWVLLRWKWWRPAYILFWGRFQTDVRKSGQQKTKQTWNVSQIQTAFWGDLKSWHMEGHVTSVGRHLHCYHSNTKIWPDRLQIIMQDSRWNKSDLSAVWTKLDR